jgi:transcriptional regulator with XRE-family HTH domain
LQPLDAERVKEWRHRRMLSQQEVADRAGTSLFTVQRIERGEGNVRPKTGRGLAAALGVPIEELLPKAQAPLFRELPEQEPSEERRLRLLEPIAPAAIALNALFAPKVGAKDFTIEEYEQVGDAFARLDRLKADAVSSEYIHSERASEAVLAEFNRAWVSMDELRYTIQRAYKELVRREEAGVTKLEEFRQRAG